MIDEFKLIVKILDKASVNHLELFTREDFGAKVSKMGKLFQVIKNNEFETMDELKSAFLETSEQEWGFQKLQMRFKEKLANTLFFVDTNSPKFSERAKAYYTIAKRALSARMLSERGAIKMANEVAENTIPISMKYEFTDLSLLLLRILKKRYAREVKLKKLKHYLNLFDELNELFRREVEMEHYLNILIFQENALKDKDKKIIQLKNYDKIVKDAIYYLESDPSVELILSCAPIVLNYFREKSDFKKFNYWAFYALDLVLAKQFFSETILDQIIIQLIRGALISKDYLTLLQLEKKYFSKINNINFNWYVRFYYFILTNLHSKQYQIAYDRFTKAFDQKNFKQQPPVITELFLILQAYIHYLIELKKIIPTKDTPDFRLNKFLNQVPEYSKDKSGANVSILLIQILFLLKDGKYNKIIDRMEALKLYSYRHLRKDENFRSQCFFRMLNEMIRADFKKKGTVFRTEKWLKKLESVKIESYPNAADKEILPYEDMWELVLEQLK